MAMTYAANRQLAMEYFFFNELDNIKKFDDVSRYPSIKHELNIYPQDFIAIKISKEPENFFLAESQMYSLLCAHSDQDRYLLRNTVMYYIHEYLMNHDYGGMQYSLDSDSRGVIKEAHDFLPDE